MRTTLIITGCLTILAAVACHSQKQQASAEQTISSTQVSTDEVPILDPETLVSTPTRNGIHPQTQVDMQPKAVIYKTNGNYADHVPIVLSSDRSTIVSFPAPSDLRDSQRPISLTNGWLLDCRGAIGANTAFLRYSYEEYAALSHAPSISELRSAIIPDAYTTEAYRLPMTLNEARNDTSSVNTFIRTKLQTATPLDIPIVKFD